ncbi:MAG: hypothetical protein Q8M66_00190 [Actinomycetota bacterium]|nr:hypothetical protein [Actinomycetota bacterium]
MKKQIAYANNKILESVRKRQIQFLMFLVVAMVGLTAVTFAASPTEQTFENICTYGGGTASFAIIFSAGSITPASNAERQGKQIYYKIYLLHESQWQESSGFPAVIDGVRSTIPVKSGEKWHYIGAVDDTAELGINAEAGEIASAITNDLKFVVGGINKKIRAFLKDGLNEKFFIVVKSSHDNKMFVGGDAIKPMKLVSFSGGAMKDNTSMNLEFKNESIEIWSEYSGALPTVEPVTVPANATTITLTADADQYLITSGASAAANITGFTSATAAHHLKVVELIGLGGTHPATIDDDDDFLLIDGTTWTSTAGARISFQIYKMGASSYKYIEVPGSRKA